MIVAGRKAQAHGEQLTCRSRKAISRGPFDLSERSLEAEQAVEIPVGEVVSGAEESITRAISERIRSIHFIHTTHTVRISTDLCKVWDRQEAAHESPA